MNRNAVSAFIKKLLLDCRASTLVEFAMLAPVFILLLIGMLQIGIQIQNYNAVRNLASDGARYAVVQYQKGIKNSTSSIETWIRARAISGQYSLNTDRLGVAVSQPLTGSQIAGTTEMDINVTYAAPNFVPQIAASALNLSYTRPVFLMD